MSRQSPSRDRFEDYVPVAERLERFYERFPDGRVITHIIEHNMETGFVLMRAEVYRNADDAQPAATGHAFEVRSEGYVQKTSYIEVCETSSVGRALALLGFEVKRGIASREEIEKPLRMAAGRAAQSPSEPSPEEQAARLDAEILQSAAALGYDEAKVRKWVNQKFKVTEGLTGLSPDLKREVLKTFRDNAARAQAKGARE
jgi:hypothetical protein